MVDAPHNPPILEEMPDTTFLITPVGDDLSMIPDGTFNNLQTNNGAVGTNRETSLDWLLNTKKICVVDQTKGGSCWRAVYEATYGIDQYGSYNTPVTQFGAGGMETSPINPHKYSLVSDPKNVGSFPSSLTGEALGSFFHHKGSWYAGFDDLVGQGGSLTSSSINSSEKIGETSSTEKKIYVLDKFFPNGQTSDASNCECGGGQCNFNDSATGGDEGYSQTFQLNRVGIPTTLDIFFQAYQQKDAIIVTASSGQSYSSGCIGGSASSTLNLPNGAESITVVVQPNCEGGGGTVWDFNITCIDNAPP